jgi:flagellar basal body-associated protein FliL
LEHFVLRHGAKSPFKHHQSGEKMAHKKLISLAVMITIFASVGGITWALVNAQQTNQDETQLPPANMPKLMIHEEIRTAAISYINQQHPETAQFTTNSS